MVELLSHGPKTFGVVITKGTRQPHSSNFHLFLSAVAPLKIVHHAKSDFLGFDPKFSSFLQLD